MFWRDVTLECFVLVLFEYHGMNIMCVVHLITTTPITRNPIYH